MSTFTTCVLFQSKDSCLSQTSRRGRSNADSSQGKVKPAAEGRGGGTVEKSLSTNLSRAFAFRESPITCRQGLESKSKRLQFVHPWDMIGTRLGNGLQATISLHTLKISSCVFIGKDIYQKMCEGMGKPNEVPEVLA